MRRFNYSFLEVGMLPAGLVNVVGAISQLKERGGVRKENHPEVFARLEGIAKVQSVKNSNEIEGIVSSEQRIVEIVNQGSAPRGHNEADIAGYCNVLDYIHKEYRQLDIRERDILHMHQQMLSLGPVEGGCYKHADNAITELDARGMWRVRFAPTPAAKTAKAMGQWVLAYADASKNSNIHPLLLAPCCVLDFLCIHPFADGTGRLSRLLSLLLLYKSGFDVVRYISFEAQINRDKAAYYQSLKDSSLGWHEGHNRYFPFIEHFVTTLLCCYRELDKRFAVVGAKKANKQRRIEATVWKSLLPISKAEIAYVLVDVSPSTIEAVLSKMLKAGQIQKVGSARHTKYVKVEQGLP
jgi:Fic family protein